jgi:hypothetical protein
VLMDLNRVLLSGRLDKEPLLWQVGDHPLATLCLASRRSWRAADGRRCHATEAYQFTAWEELAEWCGRSLHVGDRIYAEGRLCVAADGRCEIVLDRLLLARPAPPAAGAALVTALPAV